MESNRTEYGREGEGVYIKPPLLPARVYMFTHMYGAKLFEYFISVLF